LIYYLFQFGLVGHEIIRAGIRKISTEQQSWVPKVGPVPSSWQIHLR